MLNGRQAGRHVVGGRTARVVRRRRGTVVRHGTMEPAGTGDHIAVESAAGAPDASNRRALGRQPML